MFQAFRPPHVFRKSRGVIGLREFRIENQRKYFRKLRNLLDQSLEQILRNFIQQRP